MTEAALVEGQVKLRDGKKVGARGGRGAGAGRGRTLTPPLSPQWKTRWLVLRKPSPVAGERWVPLAVLPGAVCQTQKRNGAS